MKRRNRLVIGLTSIMLLGSLMTSCDSTSSSVSKDEIHQVYDSYVANGGTLSYEEWLASIKGTLKGEKGDKGDAGKNGSDGKDGKDGSDGKDGYSLLSGEGEPSSSLGKDGDSYVDVSTWDYYTKKDGSWKKTGNIKGANGEQGENGKNGTSVLTGNGVPSDELGDDGDSYIDNDTFDYYVKSDGAWSKKGNIKGATGSQGEKGDTGSKGGKGDKGDSGDNGSDGKSAYEIYKETYPGYAGSEKDWISDLALGKLSVTISFDTNGGNEIEDRVYCKGEEVKISETTSKDDWSFTGWYLDEETTLLANTEFIAAENLTLYAGFHPNTVSVTYIVDDTIYKVDTFDYESTLGELEEAPEKLGYTFTSWEASVEPFNKDAPLTYDVTLTAKYDLDRMELPAIEINTENKAPIVSKEEYVKATVSVSNSDGKYDFSNAEAKIKGRGNSTFGQPKKPYKIKFDKKTSMLGSSYKAKSWVLLANYFDKSLSRNALAYDLSSRMEHIAFSSAHEYVDVYLNGEYVGVYLLADQIETGKGRVEVDEEEVTDGNGGYLMELDQPSRIEADGAVLNESYFASNSHYFAFKTPDIEDDSFINNHEAYINYIKSYMDSCFDAMNGTDWTTITDLMDVESFAETYLIQELFANNDCGYSSFYLVKDKDDKLEAGPVWDFDIGGGNLNYNMGTAESCSPNTALWARWANIFYQKLLNHSEFKEMVTVKIYSYEQTFNELIELANPTSETGIYSLYQNALNRNFDKWQIMGHYVWPEPNEVVALTTVSDQLQYLYNWLSARYVFMKEQYPQASE